MKSSISAGGYYSDDGEDELDEAATAGAVLGAEAALAAEHFGVTTSLRSVICVDLALSTHTKIQGYTTVKPLADAVVR